MLRPEIDKKQELIRLWKNRKLYNRNSLFCCKKKETAPLIVQQLNEFIEELKFIPGNELSLDLKMKLGGIIFNYNNLCQLDDGIETETIKKIKILVWGEKAAPIYRACQLLLDVLDDKLYRYIQDAKDPEEFSKQLHDQIVYADISETIKKSLIGVSYPKAGIIYPANDQTENEAVNKTPKRTP